MLDRRSLEYVGEWWNILILRDIINGMSRFEEFQKNLGIAPNTLTRRLKGLVESELLSRRRYSQRPPRDEYVLTQSGRDFMPVIAALLAWGNKHCPPDGTDSMLVCSKSRQKIEPVVVDKKTGKPVTCDSAIFCESSAVRKPDGARRTSAHNHPKPKKTLK